MEQINIFETLYEKFTIKNRIRLIELFGGIGSQAKAMENLDAQGKLPMGFEHYRLVEYDKFPVASYNAIHNTNFTPIDITKIHAEDLGIVDRDKYTYLCCYSFPCQDLSLSGKGKGMAKGSGTRSGLLWEVERLLNECGEELPQVLLMENVPQVISEKNIDDFKMWELFLESKGYSNYMQILNSKNYGIPQNRQRCFMVSILGDAYYEFPKPIPLKLKLEDMLDNDVDEKYFLDDKAMKSISFNRSDISKIKNKYIKESLEHTDLDHIGNAAFIDGFNRNVRQDECSGTIDTGISFRNKQFLLIKNNTKKGYLEAHEGDGVDISARMESHRGTVQKRMAQTLKTSIEVGVVVRIGNYSPSGHNASSIVDSKGIAPCVMENHGTVTAVVDNLRVRKLSPKEAWRLMGFSSQDFEKAAKVTSNAQLYKQAGNSIVVNVLMAIFSQLL